MIKRIKTILLCLFVTAFLNAQTFVDDFESYNVGDYISDTHQNITQSTCYAGNEYGAGDDWKLADWNGATNGGHHTVIFIEMSATW